MAPARPLPEQVGCEMGCEGKDLLAWETLEGGPTRRWESGHLGGPFTSLPEYLIRTGYYAETGTNITDMKTR